MIVNYADTLLSVPPLTVKDLMELSQITDLTAVCELSPMDGVDSEAVALHRILLDEIERLNGYRPPDEHLKSYLSSAFSISDKALKAVKSSEANPEPINIPALFGGMIKGGVNIEPFLNITFHDLVEIINSTGKQPVDQEIIDAEWDKIMGSKDG